MGLTGTDTLIFDVYGMPFNYYCSPNTPYQLVNAGNGYTQGGQVNVASYDLFSYGKDQCTFADTNATAWPPVIVGSWGTDNTTWTNAKSALDDITNWRQY